VRLGFMPFRLSLSRFFSHPINIPARSPGVKTNPQRDDRGFMLAATVPSA
jgi:hypothetical protein